MIKVRKLYTKFQLRIATSAYLLLTFVYVRMQIMVVQVHMGKNESQLRQVYCYILYPFCPKNSDDTYAEM